MSLKKNSGKGPLKEESLPTSETLRDSEDLVTRDVRVRDVEEDVFLNMFKQSLFVGWDSGINPEYKQLLKVQVSDQTIDPKHYEYFIDDPKVREFLGMSEADISFNHGVNDEVNTVKIEMSWPQEVGKLIEDAKLKNIDAAIERDEFIPGARKWFYSVEVPMNNVYDFYFSVLEATKRIGSFTYKKHSVASLNKKAAQFMTPPPAMLRRIWQWAVGEYSSRVLESIREINLKDVPPDEVRGLEILYGHVKKDNPNAIGEDIIWVPIDVKEWDEAPEGAEKLNDQIITVHMDIMEDMNSEIIEPRPFEIVIELEEEDLFIKETSEYEDVKKDLYFKVRSAIVEFMQEAMVLISEATAGSEIMKSSILSRLSKSSKRVLVKNLGVSVDEELLSEALEIYARPERNDFEKASLKRIISTMNIDTFGEFLKRAT